MHNVFTVQVGDSTQYLRHELLRFTLFQFAVVEYVIEQLATCNSLHYNAQ